MAHRRWKPTHRPRRHLDQWPRCNRFPPTGWWCQRPAPQHKVPKRLDSYVPEDTRHPGGRRDDPRRAVKTFRFSPRAPHSFQRRHRLLLRAVNGWQRSCDHTAVRCGASVVLSAHYAKRTLEGQTLPSSFAGAKEAFGGPCSFEACWPRLVSCEAAGLSDSAHGAITALPTGAPFGCVSIV